MTTIIGISGSLRRQSYNTALLQAAVELAPAGVQIEIASIDGIPLYNNDVETGEGIPPAVAQLKERITAAQGLLLVTPEYNNAMPGVLKNAIDWLTRPPADIPKVFSGRAVAIMGASPGLHGTMLSQNSWLPVVRTLRMRPWFDDRLMVARADTLFDSAGRLTDEETRKRLARFISGFAKFLG